MSIQKQVIEFHKAFDHPIAESPTVPSAERVRFRARLVLEEALEFIEALFDVDDPFVRQPLYRIRLDLQRIIDVGHIKVDLTDAADALADLDYVVEGSRLEFGVNGVPIAAEVHRSNMAKLGGGKRADGKQNKPEGWTPPNIAVCLELQRKGEADLKRVLWILKDRAARREEGRDR